MKESLNEKDVTDRKGAKMRSAGLGYRDAKRVPGRPRKYERVGT